MKLCTAPILKAVSIAVCFKFSLFPELLIKQGPELSQKLRPNLKFGTEFTKHSCKSSTVFMKCAVPRIRLHSLGGLS